MLHNYLYEFWICHYERNYYIQNISSSGRFYLNSCYISISLLKLTYKAIILYINLPKSMLLDASLGIIAWYPSFRIIRALEHSQGMSSTKDSDKKFWIHFTSFSWSVFFKAMNAFIEISLDFVIMDLLLLAIDLDFFKVPWLGGRVRASQILINSFKLLSSSSWLHGEKDKMN